MEAEQVELLGVGRDPALYRLRRECDLPLKVEHRLAGIHQRFVEHHCAAVELQVTQCAADRNTIVTSNVEDKGVADVQISEADH